jgi:hypothetical protein
MLAAPAPQADLKGSRSKPTSENRGSAFLRRGDSTSLVTAFLDFRCTAVAHVNQVLRNCCVPRGERLVRRGGETRRCDTGRRHSLCFLPSAQRICQRLGEILDTRDEGASQLVFASSTDIQALPHVRKLVETIAVVVDLRVQLAPKSCAFLRLVGLDDLNSCQQVPPIT